MLTMCVSANSQVTSSHGTILVATMTKNEVTVAEDSRVRENGRYTDDDCKIVILRGKIIFGFTGTRSFDLTAVGIHWEAHAAAIQAYKMSAHKTAYGTAEEFAILADHAFGDAIKVMGLGRFTQQTGADPNGIAAAVFAGIDTSGELGQFVVDLSYSAGKSKIVSKIERVAPTATNLAPAFALGSDTDVVNEFLDGKSFRSQTEIAHWNQAMAGKSPDERTSLLAVQLVKWAIMYTKEPDIGGYVDYVVLSRAGIADHRKASCQTSKQAQ